jgi:hypothetical protein
MLQSCDIGKDIKTEDVEIKTEDVEIKMEDVDIRTLPVSIKYDANIILNSMKRDEFIITLFLNDKNDLGYDIDEDNIKGYIQYNKKYIKGDVEVEKFDKLSKGCAYSIVMDYSGSMYNYYFNRKNLKKELIISNLEKSVDNFIQLLNDKKDIVDIIKFGTEVEIVSDFTSDKNVLTEKIYNDSEERGGTALYQATLEGLKQLKKVNPKDYSRALVLFTDGGNSEDTPTIDDVIKYAQKSHIPIFSIGLKSPDFDEVALRKISKETGGFYFEAKTVSNIKTLYEKINNTFNNQYLVNIKWYGNDLPATGSDAIFHLKIIDGKHIIASYEKNIVLP